MSITFYYYYTYYAAVTRLRCVMGCGVSVVQNTEYRDTERPSGSP